MRWGEMHPRCTLEFQPRILGCNVSQVPARRVRVFDRFFLSQADESVPCWGCGRSASVGGLGGSLRSNAVPHGAAEEQRGARCGEGGGGRLKGAQPDQQDAAAVSAGGGSAAGRLSSGSVSARPKPLVEPSNKHGLSTEPVPVSAFVGSSKNLKDLKDNVPAAVVAGLNVGGPAAAAARTTLAAPPPAPPTPARPAAPAPPRPPAAPPRLGATGLPVAPTEQFPVSAYAGSSKNLKDLKDNSAPAAVVAGLSMGAGLPVAPPPKKTARGVDAKPRKARTCKLCNKNGGAFAATSTGKNGTASKCQHIEA